MSLSDLPSRVRVVLVRTRNPLNIGAAARAMSNFGFQHLRVVNPFEAAFREARSGVGATEILKQAEEYASLADAVGDCELVVGTAAAKHRGFHQPLIVLEGAANRIRGQNSRVAVLFGSEKRGLSNEELSYCQWVIQVPTSESQPSMNLGQAVAVCLYELSRPVDLVSEEPLNPGATARELDLITNLLADALYDRGYMSIDARPSTEHKLRLLVRRLNLSADDAQLLLGIVRKLTRK